MLNRRIFRIVVFLACTMAIGAVAAIYTGHVIIAVVLGAFATGVLAILWFVVGAVIETVQDARRMLQ
jgi:hypothetical protein